MKKIVLAENHSKNKFYLLCLFLLCLQSCEVVSPEVQASADEASQRFSGPSYSSVSSSERIVPGENLGYVILLGTAYGETQPGVYNKSVQPGFDNIYASTDKGWGLFSAPNENKEVKKSKNIINNLFFKVGLEFISKRSGNGDETTTLNYLQIPLFGIYQYQLNEAGSIFGGLGPYLAYGIGGKIKEGSDKTHAFGGADGFNRFDAGLGLTAGYKISHSFSFSLVYDIGFVNIQSDASADKAHNRDFSLNVSYPLHKLIGKIKGK